MNIFTSSVEGEGAINTTTGTAPSDLTTSGAIAASASGGFGPFMVVGAAGIAGIPSIAGFGDSITTGTGDQGANGYLQ